MVISLFNRKTFVLNSFLFENRAHIHFYVYSNPELWTAMVSAAVL